MQKTEQLPPQKLGKVWSSGDTIVITYYNLNEISPFFKPYLPQKPLQWELNDFITDTSTPEVFTTVEPEQELSEFERSMMELVKEGLASDEYVQDVFQQEQIFRDNFDRINKENPNHAIVVCGGEIFVGDSIKELEKQAKAKYPKRPTYSYTPSVEF